MTNAKRRSITRTSSSRRTTRRARGPASSGPASTARSSSGIMLRASRQRNADTLRAWLKANFDDKADAEPLLWLAFSIVGRIAFDLDNPETVAELWIGIEMLEHVIRLDP